MLALRGGSSGIDSIQILTVLFAIISVIFWRSLLKILLMIAAMLLVVLITSGAIALLEGLHHLVK